MKRILYILPAIVICFVYGMLTLLAGGFASFQLRAWLVVLLPLAAGILLIRGIWWGGFFGAALGGILLISGLPEQKLLPMILGGALLVYYLVLALVCRKDIRNTKK